MSLFLAFASFYWFRDWTSSFVRLCVDRDHASSPCSRPEGNCWFPWCYCSHRCWWSSNLCSPGPRPPCRLLHYCIWTWLHRSSVPPFSLSRFWKCWIHYGGYVCGLFLFVIISEKIWSSFHFTWAVSKRQCYRKGMTWTSRFQGCNRKLQIHGRNKLLLP